LINLEKLSASLVEWSIRFSRRRCFLCLLVVIPPSWWLAPLGGYTQFTRFEEGNEVENWQERRAQQNTHKRASSTEPNTKDSSLTQSAHLRIWRAKVTPERLTELLVIHPNVLKHYATHQLLYILLPSTFEFPSFFFIFKCLRFKGQSLAFKSMQDRMASMDGTVRLPTFAFNLYQLFSIERDWTGNANKNWTIDVDVKGTWQM
jgi:hypothetical protein